MHLDIESRSISMVYYKCSSLYLIGFFEFWSIQVAPGCSTGTAQSDKKDLTNFETILGKKNNGHLKIMLANTNKALYVRNIVTLRGTKKSVVV